MERLCILVKVTDKAYDPLRLMILDILRSVPSSILKMDGKLWIQIGSLMKTALYICCSESCFLKNLGSGRKFTQVPVPLVFPNLGRSPASSSMVGIPLS